jgi:hypothetical protein
MSFQRAPSPGFIPSGVEITGWSHSWQVYLAPVEKHEYAPSALPPPFEAYGPGVEFVLEKCCSLECSALNNPKVFNCKDYTLKQAKKEQEFIPLLFKNYATVFGAVRNKRVALSTKKRKAAMQDDLTEEDIEEEQDMDAVDAKSEESSENESEEEEEEEEDDQEESEEDVEEDEEEEEEVGEEIISPKCLPKRGCSSFT